MLKRKPKSDVPPPDWILKLETTLAEDPRIESVELKRQGSIEDRAFGVLVIEMPPHPEVFIMWATVNTETRILFNKFIFEGFPGHGILEFVEQVLTDSIRIENKGRLFRSSRLTVDVGGEPVSSDWSSGWYRAG